MMASPAPNSRLRGAACAALACALQIACSTATAQTYPARPVKLVIPFAPGGSIDLIGRVLAQRLSERTGQSFYAENRAGGGTNIGAEYVAQATPDGYTLFVASSTQAINTSLYPKLNYDLLRDFAAVSAVASNPGVLIVHPALPVRSVKELVALARAKPASLSYASSGSGTSSHLATELFKIIAGVDIVHVPYKGAGPALTDLIGGHVQVMITITVAALPSIKTGRLRPLGVTTARRVVELPDTPTLQEAGIKDYEMSVWCGLLAPAGTRADIVSVLHGHTSGAVKDLGAKFAEIGAYPMQSTPEQFNQYLRGEIAKWAQVVKRSGARVE